MQKHETIAQLKRRIEMLEAKLETAEGRIDKHMVVYRDQLYTTTEQQTRIIQAVRILEGTD